MEGKVEMTQMGMQELHEIIILAIETAVSEIITAAVDSFFPQDIDNPSKTESKEVECSPLHTVSNLCHQAISSVNSEESGENLCNLNLKKSHLVEIVRLLKEHNRLRGFRLGRMCLSWIQDTDSPSPLQEFFDAALSEFLESHWQRFVANREHIVY